MERVSFSKNVVSIDKNERIWNLFEKFLNGYRKIPVLDNKKLVGIVCETDILNFLGAGDKYQYFIGAKQPMSVKIDKIMTRDPYTIKEGAKKNDIVNTFIRTGKGAFPIVNGGKVKGIITEWDLLNSSRIGHERIDKIMTTKPFTVKQSDTVFDAAKMMIKGGFRRLPVIDNNILIGIATPSDILYHIYSNQRFFSLRKEETKIADIMKKSLLSLEPKSNIRKAANIMLKRKVGGLPVVEDRELMGLITERDIVNYIFRER